MPALYRPQLSSLASLMAYVETLIEPEPLPLACSTLTEDPGHQFAALA